jgi:Cu(I)/Ag(I) efflux system membrane fusion protein
MHTQVHENKPGNCPICGMKLIRVELTESNDKSTGAITLTAAQIQLAGIQTDTVKEEYTGTENTLSGTVTEDENKSEIVSTRIAGRIQKLYLRTIGEKITAGQPLYTIYSEDLQEAEKEYLLAKTQQKTLHNPDIDYSKLLLAAESKLQLWGLSLQQIKDLEASGKVSATTTILSKISGTVSEIAVHEGDYVAEGMSILKTQSLNSLWVQAQLYANDIMKYKKDEVVSVSFPDLNAKVVAGKVEFVNPELSEDSKVNLLRISVPNPGGLIRPGMQAYIYLNSRDQLSLAVPASAILTNGSGSKVWVKNPDGSFSYKIVITGVGNSHYISVLSGLHRGDIVVTNGVYLLNSEYIFKHGDGGMKM